MSPISVRWLIVVPLVALTAPAAERQPDATSRGVSDPLPTGAVYRFGTTRFRHGGAVDVLRFSADGKVLISAGQRAICRWDAATGQRQDQFRLAGMRDFHVIQCVGDRIQALVSDETSLRLLDIPGARVEWALPLTQVKPLAFSTDGRRFLCIEDRAIQVRDGFTGKPIRTLKKGSDVGKAAWSGDGSRVALVEDFRITIWDAKSGKRVRSFCVARESVMAVALSTDGEILAVACMRSFKDFPDHATSYVHQWNVGSENEKASTMIYYGARRSANSITMLTFSADGRNLVAASTDGRLHLMGEGRHQAIGSHDPYRVYQTLTFSPDGKALAGATNEGVIEMLDARTGKELLSPAGRRHSIRLLTVAADGKRAVILDGDNQMRLREFPGGRVVKAIATIGPSHRPELSLSPDGKTVAIPSWNGPICLWDVETGKQRYLMAGPNNWGQNCMAVFALDNNTLISGGQGFPLQAQDMTTKQRVCHFKAAPGASTSTFRLVLSADGGTLATVSFTEEMPIHLWDSSSGEMKLTIPNEPPTLVLALSPDGGLLAQGGKAIRLWDARTGKRLLPVCPAEVPQCLTFSPDGRMLAAGDGSGAITIWETATRKCRRAFTGHSGAVRQITFAPDGKHLLSLSDDQTALVWNVGVNGKNPGEAAPSDKQLRAWWLDLASSDAARAYEALRALAQAPEQAVQLCREDLGKNRLVAPERFSALLQALDSGDFRTREQATAELIGLDLAADAELRQALQRPASLEVRRRIERILEAIDGIAAHPEAVRRLRMFELLETVGTPEARKLLAEQAAGAKGARLTEEARRALRLRSSPGR